jgi:hypothetical protein
MYRVNGIKSRIQFIEGLMKLLAFLAVMFLPFPRSPCFDYGCYQQATRIAE